MSILARFTSPMAAFSLATAAALLAGCSPSADRPASGASTSSKALADSVAAEKAQVALHLMRFDSLDFDVYSNQRWERMHVSHAANILVHYPDGHTTTGIPAHIAALKPLFAFAPDNKIKKHPVKIGTGPWTSVIGELSGTFTKPMSMPGGKTVAPTGKAYKLPMVTIGRWENGKMVEEYLMWDNAAFNKQMGIGQ